MKILLATGIYPPDAGGPATYTRALARALSSSDEHQVEVVAYGDTDGVDEKDGYRVQRIGRNRGVLARYWNFFLATYRRAKNTDVVYLQGPVSEGLPGTLAAMLARKPVVMKIVGDYAWEVYAGNDGTELLDEFLTHPHAGKIGWIERIERWTAARAKKIIVPSEYLKSVVKKWGVLEEKMIVIENKATFISPSRSREDILRSVDLLSNARVVLMAARAVPWKSADFIIDLLRDLPSDVVFVQAGSGPALQAWKEEVKKLGVMDRVRFLGWVDRHHLADWYAAADIFVLPSSYEGFAHVIAEADAAGLPSFVSDQGGNAKMGEYFPETVHVLPYRQRDAWLSALKEAWPLRVQRTHQVTDAVFETDKVMHVLSSVL